MSATPPPQMTDDEEMASLCVDIEHIADSASWAEQAWRLIRERREHERREVQERERVRLDEQQRRRRDERIWREQQLLLSQQRAAALNTAALPSSSAHRRARTAHRDRRDSDEAASAVDVPTSAMSGWQRRGLLHVWTSEGGREQEEREQREIWEGNMRGKRAQLEKIDTDRKRQSAEAQTAAKRTASQQRPHTAGTACRPTNSIARQSTAARSAWTARTNRPLSPSPPAAPPATSPCIRCALPSTSFVQVALLSLVVEHRHLSRLLHPPSPASPVPAAVRRLYPQLTGEQFIEQCSDSAWLARQVEVCHECAEWLDDNQHIAARRSSMHGSSSSLRKGSSERRQRFKANDNNDASDDEGDEGRHSVRSITQLVSRLLAMPAPARKPLG